MPDRTTITERGALTRRVVAWRAVVALDAGIVGRKFAGSAQIAHRGAWAQCKAPGRTVVTESGALARRVLAWRAVFALDAAIVGRKCAGCAHIAHNGAWAQRKPPDRTNIAECGALTRRMVAWRAIITLDAAIVRSKRAGSAQITYRDTWAQREASGNTLLALRRTTGGSILPLRTRLATLRTDDGLVPASRAWRHLASSNRLEARICAAREVALRWDGKERCRTGNLQLARSADTLALSEVRAHTHRDLEHAHRWRPQGETVDVPSIRVVLQLADGCGGASVDASSLVACCIQRVEDGPTLTDRVKYP
mmetsp:Transcript_63560/g.189423  ORF Transcript_63560/g.189423 Transcript_63560/m.189423 type:complete len:309 (+) Transcript_63560:4721-5647(+)|eukprot:6490212-Prymnesium_polylepis.2